MDAKTISLLILESNSYFEMAEEHFHLKKDFQIETVSQKITLLLDMLILPVISFLNIVLRDPSGLMTLGTTLNKAVRLWIKWFKYRDLNEKMRDWIRCVKNAGGPFISTNDSDYHMFVYADGMQRLKNSLLASRSKST